MTLTAKLVNSFKRIYLKIMFAIVGRGLVSGSQVDAEFKRELKELPAGLIIQMTVMPGGPSFSVEVTSDHSLKRVKKLDKPVDLCVRFKHLSHAFLVFAFIEGTARAFANDRMYVDGDITHAMILIRCLNRMETLILPKFIAARALKRYPDIGLGSKLAGGLKIYSRMTLNILKGA